MSVKLYWSIWLAVAVVALALFLSGNFSMMTGVIFGFVSFGLTFMGMMSLLPFMVAYQQSQRDLAKQFRNATRMLLQSTPNPAGCQP